jgi:hypothetical protein
VQTVFVSYRRATAAPYAGRLVDDLREHGVPVFQDFDSTIPGAPYAEVIDEAIEASGSFVAIIDRGWMGERRWPQRRRIDEPGDWVLREVAAAIAIDVRIVPVLVGDTEMPGADELPRKIRDVAARHAIELTNQHWNADLERLIAVLRSEPPPRSPRSVTKARLPGSKRVWATIAAACVLAIVAAVVLLGGGDDNSNQSQAQYERTLRAAFTPVVDAGAELTGGLSRLNDPPPAMRNLEKVQTLSDMIDQATTAWTRADVPESADGQRLSAAAEDVLRAAKAYVAKVRAALSKPVGGRKANLAQDARRALSQAYAELGDQIAPGGTESVKNTGVLVPWSKRYAYLGV